MANYKAVADGNADTLGIWETWDGTAWVAASVLPGASDDVYTNNNIVTVTTSQTYNSWNRSSVGAPLSITQGGQFQIDGANAIITQGIIYGTNVNGGGYVSIYACVSRLDTHIGKLTHIGNIVGGALNYSFGFWNSSIYDIDLIGDQLGGGGGSLSHGFYNYAAAIFNITGNQIGGNGNTAVGFHNVAGAIFTIIGNQIGGGGGNGLSHGFYNLGTATFNSVVGNQISVGTSSGFYGNQNIIIPFVGNAYADNAAAIYNTVATTQIIYTGNVYNKLGVMAIYAAKIFLNVTPTTVWEWSDFGGNPQYLVAENAVTGMPAEADVRKDEVYGTVGGLTGTLAVPDPINVDYGVPTDDTIGTGTTGITLEIIDRLRNCSTVAITGQQIASYNGAPAELVPTYEKRYDFVTGTPDIMYLGAAPVGTLDASTVWDLTKLVLAIDGSITSETHATDSWDNHLTASYV